MNPDITIVYSRFKNYLKFNRTAFWFSFFYVVLGGIVVCNIYPNDPLNGRWIDWGFLITLPVNMISFGYCFTTKHGGQLYVVLIIQCLVFIPTFIITSFVISKFKRRKK